MNEGIYIHLCILKLVFPGDSYANKESRKRGKGGKVYFIHATYAKYASTNLLTSFLTNNAVRNIDDWLTHCTQK